MPIVASPGAILEYLGFTLVAIVCGFPVAAFLKRSKLDGLGSGRIPYMDGLRGQLALGVALFHFYRVDQIQQIGQAHDELMDRLHASLGYNPVNIFFFLTAWLFWSRYTSKRGAFDWKGFFVGRIFRIGPGYLFTLLGAILALAASSVWAFRLTPDQTLVVAVKWLSLGFFPVENATTNPAWDLVTGQFWTLRLEWHFYLALPFLLMLPGVETRLYDKFRRLPRIDGKPLLCVVVFVLLAAIDSNYSNFGYGLLMTQISLFWPTIGWRRTKPAAWIAVALVSAVLLLCPSYKVAAPTLAFAFYIALDNPAIAKVLGHPWLVGLGTISYSTYLFHGVILYVVETALLRNHLLISSFGPWFRFGVGSATLVVIIAVSTLIYRYVEEPMIQFGKKLLRSEAKSTASSSFGVNTEGNR